MKISISDRARSGTAALLCATLAACSAGSRDNGTAPQPEEPQPIVRNNPSVTNPPATDNVESDGYLVMYKAGASTLANAPQPMSAGTPITVTPLSVARGAVVRGPVNVDALRADPNVEAVYLNSKIYKLQAASTSFNANAFYYQRGWMWGLRQVRANLAATTGAGQIVCVIDGGVDNTHQELVGKVVANRGFNIDTPPEVDSDGHGTHVAGTITGNGVMLPAMAPGAQIANANVFGTSTGTSVAQVTDAIAWCAAPAGPNGAGASVINLSLGGSRTRGTAIWVSDSTAYTNAAQSARQLGAVVVAAAGNSNTAIPSTATNASFLPAEATGVIAVGATGPASNAAFPFAVAPPNAAFDIRAGYSNFSTGNEPTLGGGIDLWAPGGAGSAGSQREITSPCASMTPGCAGGKSYLSIAGTSMASPHVAGLMALILSRSAAPRSFAKVQAAEACAAATGDALPAGTPFFGARRINAQRATTEACAGL